MAKALMIQGTASNSGKSLLTAALCRIFRQAGYSAAPFKAQNMALNSYITKEGLEIGRAQAVQAQAAGIEPDVRMNPVLLKPSSDTGSQVIVNGEVFGNYSAREFYAMKQSLRPKIKAAYDSLAAQYDIIVLEGAGSPAEINLKQDDLVNMGMASMAKSPVLLCGDIDRGGVFAQLLGTLLLLTKEEKERVKGLIINKFRGDASLLDSGIEILEEKGGIPVTGIVPYMEIDLEDEDSLTERFDRKEKGKVDLAVIRYPRISNFTDFNVFEQIPEVSVRYVTSVGALGNPDLVFLPGSKNTMGDLEWMYQNGLADAVRWLAEKIPVCGICGGYQMLGEEISDPERMEMGGTMRGMGLLPVTTRLHREKVRRQVHGTINRMDGIFSVLTGLDFEGYEIHMGSSGEREAVFVTGENKNVYGTYVHGIFDRGVIASALVNTLAEKKGITLTGTENGNCMDYRDYKEKQYDKLADILSKYLNMEEIYGMLREAHIG